ncbi:MAG TPA: electron transfer flavoprotein-ubiquinone oxidoreductase [Acidobacteriota bacterium]|nr:electron transfer flavoprotein-ubiquinone oxidoreductase [Acidobacteriota bacterium]
MEREQLQVDVLFVGAGPASLAGALHLLKLIEKHNASAEPSDKIEDPLILVIEKGREIGSHILSGAVVNPRGFDELLQDFPGKEPPYEAPVGDDALYLMGKNKAWRSPITPPPLKNKGKYVASLSKLVRWMAELCEEAGVEVYPEFPAVELLFEGEAVKGVRIGDKGVDEKGQPKANFEPGIDVLAKVTVLGEGVRGTLSLQAIRKLGLDRDSQPQIYAAGVKEVWQVPREVEAGTVYHTLGQPLGTKEFGGGFIYTMGDNMIDLGFVVGLDYEDPTTDPHGLFQQFKSHPWVREMLKDGKMLSYGAKAIPEGGYYSMPRPWAEGLLLIGDSGGFLDAQKLKGIHLGMKSGMLAAETILDCLKAGDFSAQRLSGFSERFESSWAKKEMWSVRNFRQAFQRGFYSGFFQAGFQFISGGRGLIDPMPTKAGHERMHMLAKHFADGRKPDTARSFDNRLTFDKLESVFNSDTAHEEDQPCHLKIADYDICNNRCTEEYGNPCQHFCPAHVYEMVEESGESGKKLRVNFTNCVHCKTCDIMDPYQIITWTPPEGGGGPDWKIM